MNLADAGRAGEGLCEIGCLLNVLPIYSGSVRKQRKATTWNYQPVTMTVRSAASR
jgi:hypothetical protein